MKTKYYLGLKSLKDSRYYIHSEDCPILPSPEKRIYLGTFLSPGEAETAARRYYSNIGFCRFCLCENHMDNKNQLFTEPTEKRDFISSTMIINAWESILVCGIN